MDKKEFKRIYLQYHNIVSKIAYDVIKDYYLAQDITQDVFAALYQKRGAIETERVKGWLITCATRKAIDYRRRTYFQNEVAGGAILAAPEVRDLVSAENEIILREIYGEILAGLYQKSPEWFSIVVRLDVEEEPPWEVAEDLGITLNNLRVKHHRAMEWLHRRFEQ